MHITLLGDPCTGKSSILEQLAAQDKLVVFEEGWKRIPKEVEEDKPASHRWFCDYFFDRDKKALATHKEEPIIFERVLHYQYPLGVAQYKSGKVRKKDFDLNNEYLDCLTRELHYGNVAVLYFLSDYQTTIERLLERGIYKTKAQYRYWDLIREETRAYFGTWESYFQINTVGKSLEQVYEQFNTILSGLE
ncbi:MAG: hypothetical protein HYY51_04350 [Candidatus Magasanikbacteria bacterium]|nr:hypothetical protein [Candidatus Magasanikbacteria bacterium]